jgi:hypothetical protein
MSGSHLQIDVDPALSLVRVVRTAKPLASAAETAALAGQVRSALAGLERARHGMLVDLRPTPFVNESRFADELATFRREVTTGFRRAAFLVETQMGRLQVQRFVRDERLPARVFEDEAAALAFVTGS